MIDVERLHALGGDDDDLGYWAKGHYPESDIRAAVGAVYGDRRHSCAADPALCSFGHGWWRKVPRGDSFQFHVAKQGAPGAFPVTFLLTKHAAL